MSDSDKYSKYRSKYYKHGRSEARNDSRHKPQSNYKRTHSKTPPLPIKLTGTMQDLVRHRESIKQELERFREPVNKPHHKDTFDTKLDRRKADSGHKLQAKRKTYRTESRDVQIKKRIRTENIVKAKSSDSSDENISLKSDEDEESIIELRRSKRKQLIETLATKDSEVDEHKSNNSTLSVNGKKHNSSDVEDCSKNLTISKPVITDMFAENDNFKYHDSNSDSPKISNIHSNKTLTDNCDDVEGYYIVQIGELLNNRYIVKKNLGQGVFSNVIHALDKTQSNKDVAIKMLRSNDLMYKTGLKEISILKEINDADPDSKYHCIRFYSNFVHRGHLCMVLESMSVDLRVILKKYGKHHGLNIKALHTYTRQLLLALKLLKKTGIVHADIKPDNILVNDKNNILKICDFGSATKIDDNEPTPYLVSRFYRAPEIILGLRYGHGVDLWSTACTIYELATGKIMFTGNTNNKMLKCFMDIKGKIPKKMIRKGKFKDQHFNYSYNFLFHKQDEVTGRDKVVEISNIISARSLQSELKHAFKETTLVEDRKLAQLKDLLDKMLIIDPNQRSSVTECLRHPFVTEEITN